jgi:tRNA G37 N-methylase Trm5
LFDGVADPLSQIDSKDNTVKAQKKRAKAKARFLKKKGLTKTDIYLKRQSEYHAILAANDPRTHLVRITAEKTWLETHVWHAKRMKMENVWGYRIVSCVAVEVGTTS